MPREPRLRLHEAAARLGGPVRQMLLAGITKVVDEELLSLSSRRDINVWLALMLADHVSRRKAALRWWDTRPPDAITFSLDSVLLE